MAVAAQSAAQHSARRAPAVAPPPPKIEPREDRIAALLLRAIRADLGDMEHFTREDLLQLAVFSHVATITRYQLICRSVHILLERRQLHAMTRSNLCLADRKARYHTDETPAQRYGETIRRIVQQLADGPHLAATARTLDQPFTVMDVVALWTTDQHLTVNSKRVAVREVLHGMVRSKTLIQADEFGYRRGKAI